MSNDIAPCCFVMFAEFKTGSNASGKYVAPADRVKIPEGAGPARSAKPAQQHDREERQFEPESREGFRGDHAKRASPSYRVTGRGRGYHRPAAHATSSEQTVDSDIGPTHPLIDNWCFWLYKSSTVQSNFSQNVKRIAPCSTVEKFWAVYCHITHLSELQGHADVMCFRDPHSS